MDMRALFKVLRNKILSALKLALISGLDMSWEAGETVRSCTLHDGEGAPQNHWVPKDSPFPSRVVAALMLARMLTLETSARPGKGLIAQTNEALGQLRYSVVVVVGTCVRVMVMVSGPWSILRWFYSRQEHTTY